MTTRTLTIQAEVKDTDLSDVLTTAYEGGIGYWFRGLDSGDTPFDGHLGYGWIAGYVFDEVENDDAMGERYGYPEMDAFVEAVEGDSLESTTLIDLDTIAAGVEAICVGRVGIRDDLLRQVMTLFTEDPDVDADAADCIVQAGLFGELVYG